MAVAGLALISWSCFPAVHFAQGDVHQDQMRIFTHGHRDAGGAVMSRRDGESRCRRRVSMSRSISLSSTSKILCMGNFRSGLKRKDGSGGDQRRLRHG